MHLQTFDSSRPLHTEMSLLGAPSAFDAPGTAASVGNADTLLLAWNYGLDEHWQLKFGAGLPPQFSLQGRGRITPPVALGLLSVDLGKPENNPIATARQWSPVLVLLYGFHPGSPRWRVQAGAGLSYTWFSDVTLDAGLRNEMDSRFAKPLALLNGKSPVGTRESAAASSTFAPVLDAAVSYALTPRLALSLSMTWMRLSTEASIDLRAADGTRLSHSVAALQIDALASALALNYRY